MTDTPQHSKVGYFMVAIGAIVRHPDDSRILVLKKSQSASYNKGIWELVFGRLNQGEDLIAALARELTEETGLSLKGTPKLLTTFHMFRGVPVAANELIGVVYVVDVATSSVTLSDEHDAFEWIEPVEAISRIDRSDIRSYVQLYITEHR